MIAVMGWAERLSRGERRGSARPLTSSECRAIAETIRESLVTLRIPLAGDLERFVTEAEWLGTFPAGPFEPGGAAYSDRQRGLTAFLLMEQARRVAWMLLAARGLKGKGVSQVLRWVTGRIDRIAVQDEQAQDYLFELEIAGRLRMKDGVDVSLEEPDIVIGPVGRPPLGSMACKRPLRRDTVGRALLKAREQITRRGLPGIIVIGMEALFHRSGDDEEKPTVIYHADRARDLESEGRRVISEAVGCAAAEIGQVFRSGTVEGLLFCGLMTGLLRFPSSYHHRWVRRTMPNPAGDGAVVTAMERLLFG